MKTYIPITQFLFLFLFTFSVNAQSLLINEFMASNVSTITDENGAYEDWIEIYNAGSSAVDIGGYYISDDLLQPTLWQIPTTDPAATTIAPGDFLLLWADKDTDEGILHVNIKLGASGEAIILSEADGTTVVDQLTFGAQSDDVSYGRSQDGGSSFEFFPASTPGTSNEGAMLPTTYTLKVTVPITNASDDGVEYGTSSGNVNLTGYGMKLVDSWSNQTGGLFFRNLNIPQGATVTNAYIQFTAKDEDDGVDDCELEIEAHDTDDAHHLEDENMDFSDRPKTSAEVEWEPVEWLIRDFASPKHQTPDLSAIVQEIVDRSGWQSGNDMAFFISGDGLRGAHNYESGFPAVLYVEVDAPIPSNPVSNIYINEIAPNGTDYQDETGDYEDWLELYNDNNFPVSVGGLYLTDDYDELLQWQISEDAVIPANGFLTIWADENTDRSGRHADFKLKAGGEELALLQVINNEIVFIDSITYNAVPFKGSTGRTTDGGNIWDIFGEITPEASNNGADSYLEPPVISLPNGIYTGSESISISHVDPSVTIRYTTDGSIPTGSSSSYNNPITLDENGSLRAVAFRSGYAPSQPATHAYLFDVDHDLPVLHIVTDPDNLWDDEIGIYTEGTNGVALEFCGSSEEANYNNDGWERPANLTFYESDNSEAFNVNAGIQIGGSCSRDQALKALNIYLRNNQYGDSNIDYQLFPEKNYTKYKRLKLRNSGQDFKSMMFRDAAVQTIMQRIPDMEVQAYRPTVVYINDEYWGVQNFRELYSDEYFDHEEDVEKEDLQLIKNPSMGLKVIKNGDDIDYQELFYFLENNSLTNQTNYDIVADQVDIDNFINYWASMVYIAADDWPANNMLVWRENKPGKKWRWAVSDTDASTNHFGTNSNTGHFRNKLMKILNENSVTWPNHANSTLLFRRLIRNDNFRAEFVQRTCSFMQLVFHPDSINPIVDNMRLNLDSEIEDHIDRWKFDTPFLQDYEDWSEKVDKFKLFFEMRAEQVLMHFPDTIDLGDTYDLTINFDQNSGGYVLVNSTELELPYDYEGVYFEDEPLRLKAVADPGYEFIEWLETGETDDVIYFIGTGDYTLTPIFQATGPNLTFECPDDIDVSISGTATTVSVSWNEPTGTTTCDVSSVVTVTQTGGPANGSDFPIGTTTITYQATDVCETVVTCSFDITVILDNGTLSINGCPGNIVVEALPGASSASVFWTEPTASTTCDEGGASINQTSGSASGALFQIGTTTDIIYEATDDCGNIEYCSFTVTVNSASSSIDLDCPSNISVQVATGITGETVSWTPPVGTSDCFSGNVNTTQIFGPASGSFFLLGNHTISYETTDDCGNIETCSFMIVVSDTPSTVSLTCPDDQILVLPVGATSMVTSWNLPGVSTTCGGGVQNPNCGTTPAGFTSIGSLDGHEYFLSGSKVPWLTAQANCTTFEADLISIGSAEENQLLEDNVDVVVHIGLNDIDTEGTLAWSNGEAVGYNNLKSNPNNTDSNDYGHWVPWGGTWNFYSNLVYKYYVMELDCGGGSAINLTQTGGPTNGTSLIAGVYIITYEASDDCGDIQVCSFSIEVQDNPQTISIDCPDDITVDEVDGTGGAIVNFLDATATTTCSGGGLAINQTSGMNSGSLFTVGTHTITFEATDACGSPVTCSFTIIVEASTPPPPPPAGEYCESEASSPWQHYINNVTFNTINNTSGKSKYSDFTDLSTSVDVTGAYTFGLTPAYSWTQWNSYVRVWIDYNGDLDFTDAGEQVAEFIIVGGESGSLPSVGTASVVIPTGASIGATRMRVSMSRNGYVEPCEAFEFGEVEDYTVIINSSEISNMNGSGDLSNKTIKEGANVRLNGATNADNKSVLESFKLFPNPGRNFIYADLKESEGMEAEVQVYNTLGQIVLQQQLSKIPVYPIRFDLSKLHDGIYIMYVKVKDQKPMSRQFIVKENF